MLLHSLAIRTEEWRDRKTFYAIQKTREYARSMQYLTHSNSSGFCARWLLYVSRHQHGHILHRNQTFANISRLY
jgi:hypothetical protein